MEVLIAQLRLGTCLSLRGLCFLDFLRVGRKRDGLHSRGLPDAYVYVLGVATRMGQVRHQAIVFDAVEPCG